MYIRISSRSAAARGAKTASFIVARPARKFGRAALQSGEHLPGRNRRPRINAGLYVRPQLAQPPFPLSHQTQRLVDDFGLIPKLSGRYEALDKRGVLVGKVNTHDPYDTVPKAPNARRVGF